MDAVIQDFRLALRTLAKSPHFTVAAVITLALGIGAATAGFTLLDWLLLRPVAGVHQPARAGFVSLAVHQNGRYWVSGITREQLDIVLEGSPAVAGLAGREGPLDVNAAAASGAARRISVEFVASDYFKVLSVPIDLGRAFAPEDDAEPGGRRVVVLSDRLWRDMYSARTDVLGMTMRVNGLVCTVIGVTPPGFRGPDHLDEADAWLPGATESDIRHFALRGPAPHELSYYQFVLRLRPGATFDQAGRQLQSAIHALALADTTRLSPDLEATVIPRLGLGARYGARALIDHQLALVLGISGLVLLVACANVANLLLLRRTKRRADTVVRLALGASQSRLVRYNITENGVLGLASGVVGLGVAFLLMELFRHFRPLRFVSLEHITVDHRVLGFAVGAGMLASVLAGVIPAVLGSHADLSSDLRASGPTVSGGAPLLRSGLAILQIAVSLSLVAGTYLFARTLQHYAAVPLGFNPDGVTVFGVDPKAQGYTPEQARAYVRALRNRIAALPGVQQVALLALPPFQGVFFTLPISPSDAPSGTKPLIVASNQISGDYFSVLGIPLLQGASFRSDDLWPDSTRPMDKVMLSARLAQELFGTERPVGRVVHLADRRNAEVVGVVGDVHWADRGGDIEPMFYAPVGQGDFLPPMLAVRSHLQGGALEQEVQQIGRGLDPAMPVRTIGALRDNVAAATASETLLFKLVGLLAGLTLALSGIGVYSLIAYGVTTRTREFGVRMALGAGARDILHTAARPAFAIVALGIVCGVAGAVYLTRFIKSSLYGVSPLDPVAFVTAAVVLTIGVLLASWIPARRAARVDPTVALRYE